MHARTVPARQHARRAAESAYRRIGPPCCVYQGGKLAARVRCCCLLLLEQCPTAAATGKGFGAAGWTFGLAPRRSSPWSCGCDVEEDGMSQCVAMLVRTPPEGQGRVSTHHRLGTWSLASNPPQQLIRRQVIGARAIDRSTQGGQGGMTHFVATATAATQPFDRPDPQPCGVAADSGQRNASRRRTRTHLRRLASGSVIRCPSPLAGGGVVLSHAGLCAPKGDRSGPAHPWPGRRGMRTAQSKANNKEGKAAAGRALLFASSLLLCCCWYYSSLL